MSHSYHYINEECPCRCMSLGRHAESLLPIVSTENGKLWSCKDRYFAVFLRALYLAALPTFLVLKLRLPKNPKSCHRLFCRLLEQSQFWFQYIRKICREGGPLCCTSPKDVYIGSCSRDISIDGGLFCQLVNNSALCRHR